MRHGLAPGVNVDRVDVAAGMRELTACGYGSDMVETRVVVEYSLQRWARGEEEAALRGAIDPNFHGITLTCWLRILAAARASAERASIEPGDNYLEQSPETGTFPHDA